MRGRSRRRGTRRTSAGLAVGVALVCLLLAGGAGVASMAADTATVPRPASVDVTVDASGAHSLDTARAVHVNSTERLVDVTNELDRDVSVTVALRDDVTHVGHLVVDGVDEGNSVTVPLAKGATERVKIAVRDDGSLVGDAVYFGVNATAPGLDVSAPDRSAPIQG